MSWVEKKWTTWTPTVTQSGSVTVTVNNAIYSIVGDICTVNVSLTVTGSGTANNAIVIGGQPSEIQATGGQNFLGTITIEDLSASLFYSGVLRLIGATDWRGITDGLGNYMGITPNFGLANTDRISFQGSYRVA